MSTPRRKQRLRHNSATQYQLKGTPERHAYIERNRNYVIRRYHALTTPQRQEYIKNIERARADRMIGETPTTRDKRQKKEKEKKKENRQSKKSLFSRTRNDEGQIIEIGSKLYEKFYSIIKEGPTFYCASCRTSKFRDQVMPFLASKYPTHIDYKFEGTMRDFAIEHFIDASLPIPQKICHPCHNAFSKARLPKLSFRNKLELDRIPNELANINTLEERLLAKKLVYMKIIALRVSDFAALRGHCSNVAMPNTSVCELLPRLPNNAQIIPIKLKRKLAFKGHIDFKLININRLETALNWLKANNPLYRNVEVEKIDEWHKKCNENDDEFWTKFIVDDEQEQQLFSRLNDEALEEMQESETNATNLQYQSQNEQQQGQQETTGDKLDVREAMADAFESVIMNAHGPIITDEEISAIPEKPDLKLHEPEDIESTISADFREAIQFAPTENKTSKSLLFDITLECECFPKLFPYGDGGLYAERPIKLQVEDYCSVMLCNYDKRCQDREEFAFLQLFRADKERLLSAVNINLRKHIGEEITVKSALSEENIQKWISNDFAYRCLQGIRGSPAYWKAAMYDLLGFIHTLGQPTWFCTFSCNDVNWPDMLIPIAKEYGRIITEDEIESIPYTERTKILRRNPALLVRQFEYRFRKFVNTVLKSEALPLGGKIKDYFIRCEFQARGSPHLHCMFWIEGAPLIKNQDENWKEEDDDEVLRFIDKCVTCAEPNDDSPLKKLVNMQRHVCKKTCYKKNPKKKQCRFKYPRPLAEKTFIKRDVQNDEQGNYISEMREIRLKREQGEEMINNYNKIILQTWRANHDISYITNAYAVAQYICAYITKCEKEVTEAMQAAMEEMDSNITAKKKMLKLGNSFIGARTVSIQETMYRLLRMPLKRASREVIFIPASYPNLRCRMLKPKDALNKLYQQDENSEDVFCSNVIDRYCQRPTTGKYLILADISLQEWVSYYSPARGWNSEVDEGCIEGEENEITDTVQQSEWPKFVKSETTTYKLRTRRRVCRWPKFPLKPDPDRYWYSLLVMFYPFTNEDQIWKQRKDNGGQYETFKDFFETDQVQAKLINKIKQYQFYEAQIEEAFEQLRKQKESESERDAAEVTQPLLYVDPGDLSSEDEDDDMPDAEDYRPLIEQQKQQKLIAESIKNRMNDEQYKKNLLLLEQDKEQQDIFAEIQAHCKLHLNKVNPPKPIYRFIHAGAGCGKSFLIKLLQEMVQRTFEETEQMDTLHILTVCPTGPAAYLVGGQTIHAALRIPTMADGSTFISQNQIHTGAELKQQMRNAFSSIKYIIIDEISMVGIEMFHFMNLRLQDVMSITDPTIFFGGISVLCFGDFYQLPPVKQRKIFDQPSVSKCGVPFFGFHPWRDLFYLRELNTVHRVNQDELNFMQLLNRMRKQALTDVDIIFLKSRIKPLDYLLNNVIENALWLFQTNKDADALNTACLLSMQKKGSKIYTIMAENLERKLICSNPVEPKKKRSRLNKQTYELQTVCRDLLPDDSTKFRSLRDNVYITEGCRIMLITNLDTASGLTNGSSGEIIKIQWIENPKIDENKKAHCRQIACVKVLFDGFNVGQDYAKESQYFDKDNPSHIPIEPFVHEYNHGGRKLARIQLPIINANGITIHKSQGKGARFVVADLAYKGHPVKPGLAYVACSRVTTASGLYFLGFDPRTVIADPRVKDEIDRLHDFNKGVITPKIQLKTTEMSCTSKERALAPKSKIVLPRVKDHQMQDETPTSMLTAYDEFIGHFEFSIEPEEESSRKLDQIINELTFQRCTYLLATLREKISKIYEYESQLQSILYILSVQDRAMYNAQKHKVEKVRLHPLVTPGYSPVDTKPDGNCLFRAISMCMYGHEMYWRLLRTAAFYILVKHKADRYIPFLKAMHSFEHPGMNPTELRLEQNYAEEIRRCIQLKEFAGDIHLDALSIALDRPIYGYQPCVDSEENIRDFDITDFDALQRLHDVSGNGHPGNFYRFHAHNVNSQKEPICVYIVNAHYKALLPTNNNALCIKPFQNFYDQILNSQ